MKCWKEYRYNQDFEEIRSKMEGYLKELKRNASLKRIEAEDQKHLRDNLPDSNAGVYVFYSGEKALYVGRSDKLKERILTHGRDSSGINVAAFAANIAREIATERF
jgi:hypothetical protein